MANPIFHSQYTAAQIEAAIGKGPRVNSSGYWEVWNVSTGAYESTGVGAGVTPPTVVTQVSQMTNHGYIYIYNGSESGYTAGYWYYWDGSAWTAGGAYQVAATDPSLSIEGAAADAKAVGGIKTAIDEISGCKIYDHWLRYRAYNTSGVTIDFNSPVTTTGYWVCQAIDCQPGDVFTITGGSDYANDRLWAWCENDGTIVEKPSKNLTVTNWEIICPNEATKLVVNMNTAIGGTYYVIGGKSLAKTVKNIDAGEGHLLCPVAWSPTLKRGEYLTQAAGKVASAASYARTNALWYGKGYKAAVELSDSRYTFRIVMYDENGTLDDVENNGYIGSSEWFTGRALIPANAVYFGLNFRRIDQGSLVAADTTNILAALSAYLLTDETLSVSGAAADAAKTAERIANAAAAVAKEANAYRGRIAENMYTQQIEVTSLLAGGINSTEGTDNGSAYDAIRCHTRYLPIPSSVRVSLGLEDYRWTVFLYSKANQNYGTHSGMDSPGYKQAITDVITEYLAGDKFVRVSFARVDGAELTTDTTDPDSDYSKILAALKIYAIAETDEGPTIAEYYQEEMTDTIASVRDCQVEPCLVLPLVTDIHYASATAAGDAYLFTKETVANMERFSREVKCDGVVCLGDLHDGGYGATLIPSSSEDAEDVGSMLLNRLRGLDLPLLFSMGNHDDCRYFNPYMTVSQLFSTYMSQSDKDVVFDTTYYGLNYYKDYSQFGVRLIEIDTNRVPTDDTAGQYGVAQETADFLSSALEGMQSDWLAIVITHAPILSDLLTEGASSISYSSRAVNAINNSGKTVVVVSGHTHYDISTVSPFLHVVVAANKNSLRDEDATIETKGEELGRVYVRQLESGTKDLWDVVVLRPFSRVIDFVRFGSGVNRRYYITPVAPTTLVSDMSGSITWSTSDADIATVSDGTVTGVGTGRCGITATDADGNSETWIVEVS